MWGWGSSTPKNERGPAPAAQPLRLVNLSYAPLPWQTHPIDTTPDAPQGWGPFDGPWSPFDFPDLTTSMFGDGIDITYAQADNNVAVGVPGVLGLFLDNSTSLVNNSHVVTSVVPPPQLSSTIGNAYAASSGVPSAQPKSSVISAFLQRVKANL